MILDIGSPAFINNNGGITVPAFLNNHYNKSYKIDYKLLHDNIVKFYNLLIIEKRYEIKLEARGANCTIKKVFMRPEQMISDIDHFFWINYYLDARNCELGYPVGPAEINRIKKYLKNMKNSVLPNPLEGSGFLKSCIFHFRAV